MPEQLPKEKVSLDDLKIMIDGYDRNRRDPDAHWHRAEAWSTAFEWLHGACQRKWEAGVTIRNSGNKAPWIAVSKEIDEGMTLIREKLS